jgi:hypothetical protein
MRLEEEAMRKPAKGQENLFREPRDKAPGPYAPEFVYVPLSNGGHAIVDEEDYPVVAPYNWFKVKHGNSFYAFAHAKRDGLDTTISMHRLLFGLTKEDRIDVDHKNHDGLDNRRSENLRLATRKQNAANARKHRRSLSKYKGVTFSRDANKWIASIKTPSSSSHRRLGLGYYEVEEEAAFAYSVAAPLIMDPAFVHVSTIPEGVQPSTERQREIRATVIAKVKAALAGKKARLGATSKYHNVYRPKDDRWRAIIKVNGTSMALGHYDSESEAAFAYNLAASISGGSKRRVNSIPENELPAGERAAEIKALVERIIEAREAGKKGRLVRHSQFRGITYSKKDRGWRAVAKVQDKVCYFGHFQSDTEAAFAYNLVVQRYNLMAQRFGEAENDIPVESLPSPERCEAIRTYMQRKFDGEKGSLISSSSFLGVVYLPRRSRWMAQTKHNGRNHYLGEYKVETEAAFAYNCACEITGKTPNKLPNPLGISRDRLMEIRSRITTKLRDRSSELTA